MSTEEKVVFTEEPSLIQKREEKYSGLYGLVISWGLAKDKETAERVLIMISLICFALAIAVPFILL